METANIYSSDFLFSPTRQFSRRRSVQGIARVQVVACIGAATDGARRSWLLKYRPQGTGKLKMNASDEQISGPTSEPKGADGKEAGAKTVHLCHRFLSP